MTSVAGIDFVVGVDTHKETHSAAVVDPAGGVRFRATGSTDLAGLERLIASVREQAPVGGALGENAAPTGA